MAEDEQRDSELWTWKSSAPNVTSAMPKQDDEGVSVDVINVSYCVMANGKEKQLLRDVNISLQPGEMCALMGPSGAGKR